MGTFILPILNEIRTDVVLNECYTEDVGCEKCSDEKVRAQGLLWRDDMKMHASGSFEMKNWDEKPYNEAIGEPKLARASVVNVYHGDIEGEGALEYLLCYSNNTVAYFTGYERVTGRIGDRSGSFVLQHGGTFENDTAKATLSIVPGSGTGNLQGLQGEGGYVATHTQTSVTLDYEIG